MGQLKPLDIENINRPHHSMHRVLITEILVEFTVAALIIMGAGPEVNTSFHMMQAGLLPGRQVSQSIFPINDITTFARWDFTLLTQPAVFAGCAAPSP